MEIVLEKIWSRIGDNLAAATEQVIRFQFSSIIAAKTHWSSTFPSNSVLGLAEHIQNSS